MRRRQLIELEDQAWFPAAIRDAATDYLRFMLTLGNNYAPAAPLLARLLRQSGAARIVDLCSGGGGPWQRMRAELAAQGETPDIVLTDKYPNAPAAALLADGAAGGGIAYHPESVDALNLPGALSGLRTMFSAFHHFPPAAAQALLHDAQRRAAPIAIFETTQRSVVSLLLIAGSPLFVFLAMPFVRPFRWRNLLFTYVIPVLPLMVLWDGIVSCLRCYTPEELRGLIAALPPRDDYSWEVGEAWARGAPLPVTYVLGLPSPDARAS
ncbi:MAG: class I SAM-dependent methyltransferase [Deltaproteobacteria bacterium]|nr:class I SAM-dependent methyltransferase [Deltaproteobacteria bacterium]